MSFLRSLVLTPLRLSSRGYSPKVIDVSEVSNPGTMEIKKYLKRKGYSFTDPESASLKFVLPKHTLDQVGADRPPHKWKDLDESLLDVYVDKLTGRITIPSLPLSASWRNFWSSLLKESPPLEPTNLRLSDDSPHLTAYNASTPIEKLSPEDFKRLLKTFKLINSKLKPAHFAYWGARVSLDHSCILFPVKLDSKSIVGIRRVSFNRQTKSIEEDNLFDDVRDDEDDKKRLLPLFHGYERVSSSSEEVIFVSSVLDSVALTSVSKELLPIALAEGARCFPPEHLPFFESFQRVKIWFSNEEVRYWDHAFLYAKKCGEKRSEVMSKEVPQPLKCLLQGVSNLKELCRTRMLPCKHKYVTTFEGLRDEVKLEFMNFEKCQGTKWKRFPALNDTLKGFRRGELTVFSGRTGSGKTTFISEFSLDLCMRGINTLWGSFEVKNVRLAKMQLKQYSLVNLESHVEEFDKWADEFEKLPMYYLTFHGSNDVRLVLDAMVHSVYMYDIGHVIIDNIQFMMGMGNTRSMDRLLMQDLVIEQFRKFATVHNVHVTLVIHPRKDMSDLLTTNSVFGGAKATQEADNVIFLQTENTEGISKQKKYLQIVKNRFSGDLGTIPLVFHPETLTFNNKKTSSKVGSRQKVEPSVVPIPPGR